MNLLSITLRESFYIFYKKHWLYIYKLSKTKTEATAWENDGSYMYRKYIQSISKSDNLSIYQRDALHFFYLFIFFFLSMQGKLLNSDTIIGKQTILFAGAHAKINHAILSCAEKQIRFLA